MLASTVLAYTADQMRAHAETGITLRPEDIVNLTEVFDELTCEIKRLEQVVERADPSSSARDNLFIFPVRKRS